MRQFPFRKDGMKQIFDDCPHKGFARKCVALVGHGNVLDPAYHSSYVRPWSETDNGPAVIREPGYFRAWDLDQMRAPNVVRNAVNREDRKDKLLVVTHVYGQGWIVWENNRIENEDGSRTESGTVLAMYPEFGMPRAYRLLEWIGQAIQTPETWKNDPESGMPVRKE